jgi:hypothetical protein
LASSTANILTLRFRSPSDYHVVMIGVSDKTWRLAALGLLLATACPADDTPKSPVELRRIILRTQHLGAHGMGYNTESLNEMSRKLAPADIPALIELLSDRRFRVGVSFALASQCDAAIAPARDAAVQHKMDFMGAQDVMDLIAGFAACPPESQSKAAAMRTELNTLHEADQARIAEESKKREADDARIQENGLKMLDPKQAATLTRKEREEVYHRSLKAMGLDENGPLTPQQKDMVDRMYRTMVLGERGTPKPQ